MQELPRADGAGEAVGCVCHVIHPADSAQLQHREASIAAGLPPGPGELLLQSAATSWRGGGNHLLELLLCLESSLSSSSRLPTGSSTCRGRGGQVIMCGWVGGRRCLQLVCLGGSGLQEVGGWRCRSTVAGGRPVHKLLLLLLLLPGQRVDAGMAAKHTVSQDTCWRQAAGVGVEDGRRRHGQGQQEQRLLT
jgi:hypothetical protein